MPFVDPLLKAKTAFQARPTIPSNKQLKATEFVGLMNTIDTNYQELLNLVVAVSGLSPLPFVQEDVDFNITSSGIYLFYGSTARTFTIDDAIEGLVEIRTIATANLNLAGTIYSGHLGVIYQGSAATQFRWDSISGQYTY
jgi:hypothetical protein